MLPAYPLPGDRGEGKADQFTDYKDQNSATYSITAAPQTPMRAVAQYDDHQALLLTWTGNFASIFAGIIKASKPVVDIYVVHQGTAMKNSLTQALSQYGVSSSGVTFLNLNNDSIWMRDYGPLSVRSPAGDVAFIDPRYYNERVYDDAIPTKLTSTFGINVFRQPLKWEGGTFIADGRGNCFHSQGVLWYGGTDEAKIDKYMRDYMGCETRTVLHPLTDEGTTHTDMFGKMMPGNQFLLGKYKTSQDSGNAQVLEQNAQILQNATMNDGSKLSVVRIPMPSNSNRQTWRTYANSLFINGVNLIPVYTDDTTYESEALGIWQDAMPDWQHVPIDSTDLITWAGAIHCITMTVPSGKLSKFEPTPANLCSGTSTCFPSATGAGDCGLIFEGCCSDSGVTLCGPNGQTTTPCGGQSCGYSLETRAYACNASSDEPANAPKVCGAACVPSCAGKSCGPDGCGSTCGSCGSEQQCISGTCQANTTDPCTELGYEGCCDGKLLKWCQDGQLHSDSCSSNCGWNSGKAFYDCGFSGSDPSGTYSKTCPGECQASCAGKTCGDDGCGGSCGSCAGGQTCSSGQCIATCTVKCSGKQCGSDGCGGSCGTCAVGSACNSSAQCESTCAPKCDGKVCGSNGCGGVCGTCASGKTCSATGTCVAAGCGTVPAVGQCAGAVLSWCEGGALQQKDCKSLGNFECKAVPGSNPPDFDCLPAAACVPQCSGKECGANGCGGLCGECAGGAGCTDGQCLTADPCEGLTFIGCCQEGVLQWCEGGQKKSQGCQGFGCGWNAGASYYDCGFQGSGPASAPKECGASACVPSCAGKICGDDGCGGACGVCTSGSVCEAGACVSGCGDVSFEGSCSGTSLLFCESGQIKSGDCAEVEGGGCCGLEAESDYYGCLPTAACQACIPECEAGESACSVEGSHTWTCDVSGECPKRIYAWCALGCDVATGTCKLESACTAKCSGKVCGTDGCGGACGTCDPGSSCNASGFCVAGCIATCSGKQCGSDGCGGSCGNCLSGTACVEGLCVPSSCNPKCDNKVCGDNGCGGTCGTCASDEQCTKEGACVDGPDTCVPECASKPCGPDGCGGTCGICGKESICQDWQCVPSPTAACAEVPTYGLCEGAVLRICLEGSIVETDCGATGATCAATRAKAACIEPGGCLADCTGRLCGDDGCGGTCGTCSKGDACVSSQCVIDGCTPSCNGKQCGSDGCGGVCGTCDGGVSCEAGKCGAGGADASDGSDGTDGDVTSSARGGRDSGCSSGIEIGSRSTTWAPLALCGGLLVWVRRTRRHRSNG